MAKIDKKENNIIMILFQFAEISILFIIQKEEYKNLKQ